MKGNDTTNAAFVKKAHTENQSTENKDSQEGKTPVQEKTPQLGVKPEPFYLSLFIHVFKLNNCVIDSGASDNIMPALVAKALDLPLTATFGECYALDAKQVPLVGQIKDS